MKVIDLHCDLLCYLANDEKRSAQDPQSRCSFPQMVQGGVVTQVLALFAHTKKGSSTQGGLQRKIFEKMRPPAGLSLLCAIENSSVFAEEDEPLDAVFTRWDEEYAPHKPLYVSFTWNEENRFGGGIATKKGLKEEGKELLAFLQQYPIALDLSHASDFLAGDLLNELAKKGWQMPIMASHSNSRVIHEALRNLPDEIAQEIIRRKGIIGLVLYPKFLSDLDELIKHIRHLLDLGGEHALAFGADFFYWGDFEELTSGQKPILGVENSSCYPYILSFISKHMEPSLVSSIAFENAFDFITKQVGLIRKEVIEKST